MIVVVTPPPTSGRQPRLSQDDLAALAEGVRAGQWVSDGKPTPTKTAAYQRAQTAVRLLAERFNLTNVKTSACPVDADNIEAGFNWSIGPRPEGETPRKPRT